MRSKKWMTGLLAAVFLFSFIAISYGFNLDQGIIVPKKAEDKASESARQKPASSKDRVSLSVDSLKKSDWWATVQKKIMAEEYHVTYQKNPYLPEIKGAYQAPNRAQNLRTYFTSKGIRVMRRTEREPDWNAGLSLISIAKGERTIFLPKDKSPTVRGPRIEYLRGGVVEWYENRPQGLEQGFTINEKIKGKGFLKLSLDITGNVKPALSKDGQAIDFLTSSNAKVLRYSHLKVFDAKNKTLPSHFELAGNRLHIVVDDRSATYPIIVDPLITSIADWSYESDLASAQFGFSVSVAGDVNGDGYSDVIVGAPYYGTDGRAFVFHGSATGLSSTPDWFKDGEDVGVLASNFGYSVASAGEVNDDSISDVIIGAPGYDNGRGKAYVFHGSGTGLSATADWTAVGGEINDNFGNSVSCAGDVNGDGYSDVIVGAYDYNNGRAYVFHGSSSSGLSTSPDSTVYTEGTNADLGYSVSTAGDVNGDGYSDVIIGAPRYLNG